MIEEKGLRTHTTIPSICSFTFFLQIILLIFMEFSWSTDKQLSSLDLSDLCLWKEWEREKNEKEA